MTTDTAPLLATVRANPANATARLVYADALDESGDHLGAAIQRVLAEPADDRHRLNYATACEPSEPGGDS